MNAILSFTLLLSVFLTLGATRPADSVTKRYYLSINLSSSGWNPQEGSITKLDLIRRTLLIPRKTSINIISQNQHHLTPGQHFSGYVESGKRNLLKRARKLKFLWKLDSTNAANKAEIGVDAVILVDTTTDNFEEMEAGSKAFCVTELISSNKRVTLRDCTKEKKLQILSTIQKLLDPKPVNPSVEIDTSVSSETDDKEDNEEVLSDQETAPGPVHSAVNEQGSNDVVAEVPQEVPAADQTEILKQEDEDDQSDHETDSTSSEEKQHEENDTKNQYNILHEKIRVDYERRRTETPSPEQLARWKQVDEAWKESIRQMSIKKQQG